MSHADFNLQIYWVYVYSGAKLVGLLQNMTKTSLTQNGAFDVGAINEILFFPKDLPLLLHFVSLIQCQKYKIM